MTTQSMALFVTCSVWVRMKDHAPNTKQLTRLVMSGFPGLIEGTPCAFLCMDVDAVEVDSLAKAICRATHGLHQQYKWMPPTDFSDPQAASEMIAGVWYMTNNEPAEEQFFTSHVQLLLPELDSLEVAKHCSRLCRDVMPDVFTWWFPGNEASRAESPKKKGVIRRPKDQKVAYRRGARNV